MHTHMYIHEASHVPHVCVHLVTVSFLAESVTTYICTCFMYEDNNTVVEVVYIFFILKVIVVWHMSYRCLLRSKVRLSLGLFDVVLCWNICGSS